MNQGAKMKLAILAALVLSTSAMATEGHPGHENHGKRPDKPGKASAQTVDVKVSQSARAEARAQSVAAARSSSNATGGNASGGTGGNATGGAGGNASASGGSATATGGQVVVNGGGTGSGLTGRIVPDVSASSPITSTSCRNGITAGGSGNGWGGLLGFFAEDDLCEWRLLEANYRNTGDLDKANAIRSGMTLQRCEKLAPKDRELFGDLCPRQPAQEGQNPAFASAG